MTHARPRQPAVGRSLAGLYLAFAGLGATGAVVPAAIPSTAQSLGVPTVALLPAVPALFAGLLVGVVVAPWAAGRFGTGRTVAVAASLQALSLVGLAAAGATVVFVAASGVAGVGFGIAESGGTALTRLLRRTTSRTLTGLTATTAAAAACTPLAMVVAAGPDATGLVLAAAALPHLLAAATLGRSNDRPLTPPAARATSRLPPATRWASVALFCYVGAESLLSGWSAALAQTSYDLPSERAAVATSAFWVLLMIGRLAAVTVTRANVSPRAVMAVCQIGAATGLAAGAVTAAALPRATVLYATWMGVSVVLLGPCYAVLLGQGVDTVAVSSAGVAAAKLVAAGALGGAVWTAAVASTPTHVHAVTVAAAAALGMSASRLAARAAHTDDAPRVGLGSD